jgi:cell division protein FtsQ
LRIRFNRLLISLLAILILGGLIYGLGWSTLIAVDAIEIKGTNQQKLISAQLVSGNSNLIINQPLARINPRSEENLIEDLVWIKSAKVTRNWWSGKVTVLIEPRIPVAVFTKNGRETSSPIYLASDGKEFSSPQNFTELAKISLAGSSSNSQESRQLIATFVANLPVDLLATLTNLEISANGTITMSTNLRKPVLRINWGSSNTPADVTVKANVLKGLLLLPENKKITQVDLTIANSPIVKR